MAIIYQFKLIIEHFTWSYDGPVPAVIVEPLWRNQLNLAYG